MLFYSITILSTSITSSQNVLKFVTENKTCDSIKFKNELETLDICNKLKIVESLIFDILKKNCENNEEFEQLKTNILNQNLITKEKELDDFIVIDINSTSINYTILSRIDEPLRFALISIIEIVENINNVITNIYNKITLHNKSYLNKFITLCLQNEIKNLTKYSNLLDKRLQLLFELLNIYLKN